MNAICCNCGGSKRAALEICPHCKFFATDEYCILLSMALSTAELHHDYLKQAAELIKQKRPFTIPLQSNSIVAKSIGTNSIVFEYSKVRQNAKASKALNDRAKSEARNERFKRQATTLFSSIFWLFASLALLALSVYYTRDTISLVSNGIVSRAEVTSYDPTRCGSRKRKRTCHYHNLLVDNIGSVRLDLGSQYSPGNVIRVTIDPTSPQNVRLGDHTSIFNLTLAEYVALIATLLLPFVFIASLLGIPQGLGIKSRVAKFFTVVTSLVSKHPIETALKGGWSCGSVG